MKHCSRRLASLTGSLAVAATLALIAGVVSPVPSSFADDRKDTTKKDNDDRDNFDKDNKNKKRTTEDKSDFALFDGTNPAGEAPPFGGAECSVVEPGTLYVTVSSHSSSPPAGGFVRFTFRDGDWVQYPIKPDQTIQLSQSIGGTPGVDDRIRISNGGNPAGARLVGWASVISDGQPTCISCKAADGAGPPGCQNNPGP